MLFNSLGFFVFFFTVVGIYFMLPFRCRWVWLLAASYFFYGCWKVEYLTLIWVSTLVDYFVAIGLGRTESSLRRKLLLLCSLTVNLGMLFAFKYFNFFTESVQFFCTSAGFDFAFPALEVLLPVGISFYTFQTLSYTIDVYRRARDPEKHLGYFALYVSFFPQLVAGPIERSTHLLPQFFKKKQIDYERITSGLKLMLWGLFKKLVIADRLAVYVNEVYGNPGEYHGFSVLLATYFFAFQIFCDFSGYSDIAIGVSRVMGYDLMANFRSPYFSKSIAEFWSRWHISLSTWFRDYLYIPLGGSRCSSAKWKRNLIVVFLISGFWHGAAWHFVVWGALHAAYMVFSLGTQDLRSKFNERVGLTKHPVLLRYFNLFVTFHLVCFAWVFFRADTVASALVLLKNVLPLRGLTSCVDVVGVRELLISFLAVGGMELVHLWQRNERVTLRVARFPVWIRWSLYNAVILIILFFGVFNNQQFIYFQF